MTIAMVPSHAMADTGGGYDCNASADQFLSLPKAAKLPISFAGTITVLGMKSKDYAPSISVVTVNGDDSNGAGFQLTASDDDAKELELALIIKEGIDDVEVVKGHVPTGATIPFTVSVAKSGQAVFVVSDVTFQASIKPAADVKVVTICTSGRFRVTGAFTNTEVSAATGMPVPAHCCNSSKCRIFFTTRAAPRC